MDTCGAVTRAGTPCKQKAIYWNGRCKFHGGLSTGPTTEAGKEQCRINGRKGGRPRKVGAVLSDVAISAAIETEVMEPQENPKVPPDAQVSARVSDPDAFVVQFAAPDPVAPLSETEIMELGKTSVSEPFLGEVLGRVEATEMLPVRPDFSPAEPKSWMLKEVKVLPQCQRCTMFASNGACLAVAKGMIPSMSTGENCPSFSSF